MHTWHPTNGARRWPSSTRSHFLRLPCAYSQSCHPTAQFYPIVCFRAHGLGDVLGTDLDFTGGERGTRTLDLGIMSKSFQQLTAWRPLQLAPRSTTKHYWVPQNSHKKCSLSSHWPRARSVFTDRYPAGSSAARSKPAATAIGQYRTVAVTMSGSMRSLASSGAH